MTPEQTKSAYQRVCEQECEWCARGVPVGNFNVHITGVAGRNAVTCSAPSKEAFMERLATKIASMRKAMEEAPHGPMCDINWNFASNRLKPCNCWKSKFPKERSNG